MLLANNGGSSTSETYVDDCFSSFTYTGNGGVQTINNGIDLAGNGGLVWTKSRTSTEAHRLYDTARGVNYNLQTQNANASAFAAATLTAFNSNGFTLGGNGNDVVNYVSWTFRKAPKFFDVVTYTGNGVAGRQIPHNLGVAPGMVIVKRTDDVASWCVYHRSSSANPEQYFLRLDSTIAADINSNRWNDTQPTASVFSVGTSSEVNSNGAAYVAYLFAHDPEV